MQAKLQGGASPWRPWIATEAALAIDSAAKIAKNSLVVILLFPSFERGAIGRRSAPAGRVGLAQEPLVLVGSWRSRGVVSTPCQPLACQAPGVGRAEVLATNASEVPASTSAATRTFVDLANMGLSFR